MNVLGITNQLSVKNILWATDFSPTAQSALPYVTALARHFGAKVYVAHATAPDFLAPQPRRGAFLEHWRKAEKNMADLLMCDALKSVRHQAVIGEGQVSEVLCDIASEHEIDLTVVGTRGRNEVLQLLFGSCAGDLIQHALSPVMTVNPQCDRKVESPYKPRRIICEVDLMPESITAVAWAIFLGKEYEATVTLLHVCDRPSLKSSNEEIAVIASETHLGCVVEDVATRGHFPACILDAATTKQADLLVLNVGIQEQSNRAGVLSLISHAPCPVLAVRSQRNGPEV